MVSIKNWTVELEVSWPYAWELLSSAHLRLSIDTGVWRRLSNRKTKWKTSCNKRLYVCRHGSIEGIPCQLRAMDFHKHHTIDEFFSNLFDESRRITTFYKQFAKLIVHVSKCLWVPTGRVAGLFSRLWDWCGNQYRLRIARCFDWFNLAPRACVTIIQRNRQRTLWKNPKSETQNPGYVKLLTHLIETSSQRNFPLHAHWYIIVPVQFFFTWLLIATSFPGSLLPVPRQVGENPANEVVLIDVSRLKMPGLRDSLVMMTHILSRSEWAQLYAKVK